MRLSLRLRLVLLVALVVIAVAGGVSIASTQVTARAVHGFEERRLSMRDRRFTGFLAANYAQHGDWATAQPEIEQMALITGERLVLVDVAGQVVADSEGDLVPAAPTLPGGHPRHA